MSLKLRDLIRQVRACKTAAEERAVIAKESAMIRTAIREEQEHYRHRNVAKLLFMHMLGYPTHFGQLECLKLIASPHFPEKRIGYLGLMLLLSEETEVLMLATNALKNDLTSDNRFVSGLALTAVGNLATADMSRDLAPEIDKHLGSHAPYLRKKACLAMSRCLTKVPDMVEDFVDRVVSLLKDRSHGVLITVVQLMTQMLIGTKKNTTELDTFDEDEEQEDEVYEMVRTAFVKLVPSLVKLLRNLLSMGYSPDHDVGGISDPFLQVQILVVLRLVGTGDVETSEHMNDVLAQVATNTETSKNAGNAILYECVQTIMSVEAEDGLRVLAINILGRFLLNRDNNIRYVALNTLSSPSVVSRDIDAVQRHRSTIVDCLKDPDVSIRQRALELIYHLVNGDTVESLAAELLNYLVVCPREHRGEICTRVLRVVEKYSPDDRWRVDTLITMLTIAGRECDSEVQNFTIVYIGRSSEELRAYATHKLLKAIRDDDGSQRGLLVVGIWCIGEYADFLLKPYTYTPPPGSPRTNENGDITTPSEPVPVTFMALAPSDVVRTVEDVTKRHSCPEDVLQRALTCFAKLCDRFAQTNDVAVAQKLNKLVNKHRTSHSLELQLRSCEYGALIATATGGGDAFATTGAGTTAGAAKEALARMPVVDLKVMQRKQDLAATNERGELLGGVFDGTKATKASSTGGAGDNGKKDGEPNLLDLDNIFGGPPTPAPAPAAATSDGPLAGEKQNGIGGGGGAAETKPASDVDLLADIFSAPPAAPAAPVAATTAAPAPYDPFSQQPAATGGGGMDLLNPQASSSMTPAPAPAAASVDLFGGGGGGMSQPPAPAAPTPAPAVVNDTMGDFGTMGTNTTASNNPVVTAFAKDGLTIEFECIKNDPSNPQMSEVVASFLNGSDQPFYGMNLQCAVPKYVKMEILPPSSTTIPPGNNSKKVTQTIRVTNSMLGTKKLLMKLKIGFTSKGNKVDHMATFSGFPEGF